MMRFPYYVYTFLYCSGIFWLSSRPVPANLPAKDILGIDKVAHAVIFGGLAILVAQGMMSTGKERSRRLLFWIPVIFATCYGLFDECHQLFVPQRTFDLWDLVADALGAIVAAAGWHRRQDKIKQDKATDLRGTRG
jgi:VanZ family protein